MALGIEIIEEKENDLINRLEIKFKLENQGKSSPNRMDLKKEIAAQKTVEEKLTIIRKVETHFGTSLITGLAHIYEDEETLKFYEPFHIRVRNIENENREKIYSAKKKGESYKHLFNSSTNKKG
jgi:small subunit ribosomal protein S24e